MGLRTEAGRYRAEVIKTDGKVQLRSKHNKDFNIRFPDIVKALTPLPDETVIDGEIVALENGRPSFNALQNYSSSVSICFFVFDLLILEGRSIMPEPLSVRRQLLQEHVLPRLPDPIQHWPALNASLPDVIKAVRTQGLEGVIAKRLDSIYEPGLRSGAWRKMRLDQGQDFVIGGYTVGAHTLDAVIFGYYDNDGNLLYAGRTRNGFTPSLRKQLYKRLHSLEIAECPFPKLPEARGGRWGQGLTADKMKDCHWVKPVLAGRFEFVEWTPDNHLRHSKFVALREDTNPLDVRREP